MEGWTFLDKLSETDLRSAIGSRIKYLAEQSRDLYAGVPESLYKTSPAIHLRAIYDSTFECGLLTWLEEVSDPEYMLRTFVTYDKSDDQLIRQDPELVAKKMVEHILVPPRIRNTLDPGFISANVMLGYIKRSSDRLRSNELEDDLRMLEEDEIDPNMLKIDMLNLFNEVNNIDIEACLLR